MLLALHSLSGVLRLSGLTSSPGCEETEQSQDTLTPLPHPRRRELSPRNKETNIPTQIKIDMKNISPAFSFHFHPIK